MAHFIQTFLFLVISTATADRCFKDLLWDIPITRLTQLTKYAGYTFQFNGMAASRCRKTVKAISYLRPGNNGPDTGVKGTVTIEQDRRGGPTYFKIKISGLEPNTPHGFHVHASGDIIRQDCKSAGGHYNPFEQTHGAPADIIRHVGDLGNVYADNDGNVVVIKKDYQASLIGRYNIMGRSIVLHAKRDDLGRGGNEESKKTGNAGARIACGVIVHT